MYNNMVIGNIIIVHRLRLWSKGHICTQKFQQWSLVTAVVNGYSSDHRLHKWWKVKAVVKGHSSGQSLQQWSKVTAVVKGYDNAVVMGYSCCYQRLQHSCCERCSSWSYNNQSTCSLPWFLPCRRKVLCYFQVNASKLNKVLQQKGVQ